MFAGSRSFFANNRILSTHQGPLSNPIVAKRLSGARFVDVDDNTYVDLAMGYGSAMFGYSPGFVEDALHQQIASDYSVGMENPVAYENAEMISAITDQERVLFNNSGTEAVFTAVRIARAATGRKLVCVFQNAYHDHSDELADATRDDRRRVWVRSHDHRYPR